MVSEAVRERDLELLEQVCASKTGWNPSQKHGGGGAEVLRGRGGAGPGVLFLLPLWFLKDPKKEGTIEKGIGSFVALFDL